MAQADQMMGDDEGQEQGQSNGGYVIEIKVGADGAISVSSEPMQEEQGEESGEPAGQPVKSIGEAIKKVMDIYENNGESESDDAFNEGYGPAQTTPTHVRVREGQ